MGFEQRSYGGKLFRPKPHVHYAEGENVLVVATPWGETDSTETVVKMMVDYYLSTMDDFEATSPFEKLSCLSMTANHLRIACLIANEYLYREVNKSEYLAGMEIMIAAFVEREFVFAHLGFPQIFINRPNRGLLPMSSTLDLSFDLSESNQMLAPLPSQLLGLDPTCHLSVNSLRPQPDDQIVFLSRSQLAVELFTQDKGQMTLNQISRILASDDVDMPFWLGMYSFSGDFDNS